MDWIAGGTGFVIGVFITSLMNIYLNIYLQKMREKAEAELQKMREKEETKKWLRDNQLRAFSKLAKETLSLRLGEEAFDFDDPFKFLSIAAEPMLLIEDSEIKSRINNFIVSLSEIFEMHKAGEESDSKYNEIVKESRAIVDLLGSLLIKNEQKD